MCKIEDEIAEVPILGRGDHRREEHRYDVLMCRKEYGNGGVQVESLGYAIACRLLLTSSIFELEVDGKDRSPGLHSTAEGIYSTIFTLVSDVRRCSVLNQRVGKGSYFVALRGGCTRLTRAEEYCRRIGGMWMRPYFLFLSPAVPCRSNSAPHTRRGADYSVVRCLSRIDCRLVGVSDIISGVSFQISTDSSIPSFLLD